MLAAVCGRVGIARSVPDILAAAAELAALLPAPTPGSHVAFCFEHDHAAFLVALTAVWLRGHAAAMPADARRFAVGGTLALPDVVAFVHDTGAGTGIRVHERPWPVVSTAAAANAELLVGDMTMCSPEGLAAMQRIPIAAAWTRERLADYELTLAVPPHATLVNAYDPGHMPALLPGLLVPLRRGVRVVGAPGAAGEQLQALVNAHAATDLFASPERLRQLARAKHGTFGRLARVHTLGDLEPGTAARWRDDHGIVVHAPACKSAPGNGRDVMHALLAQDGVDDVAFARVAAPATAPTAESPRSFVAVAGRAPIATLTTIAAAACPGEPPPVVFAVDRIPRDHNGGLAADWVLHAAGRRFDGTLPSRALHWHDETRSERGWRGKAALPPEYCGFDGHFLGHPVLSGSVQLHDLVLPALRRALGRDATVREFLDLKFLARISPAETVDVTLEFGTTAAGDVATFVLGRGDVKCTTGRMLWTAGAS
jgi:hypothetical protein